jgi:hypothetical protein
VNLIILIAKAILSVTLLVAGSAKLADVSSFSVTLRMFVSLAIPQSFIRFAAVTIAVAEVTAGLLSMTFPSIYLMNGVIAALCGAFFVVSVLGYLNFRESSCACFGGLSQRKFDAVGMGRGAGLLILAAVALQRVPTSTIQLTASSRLLLGAAEVMLCLTTFIAARALDRSAANLSSR